jgi:phosphatidylserine decarboxylase
MRDALVISALSILPKHTVARWMGAAARLRLPGPILRLFLSWYVWKYGVDLSECQGTLADYSSVVDFFTRALRPGLRPVDAAPEAIVSPCDGRVYAAGIVEGDHIPQSESQHFSARELVGSDAYEGGSYIVIYLSPRDYHRVHVPRECTVSRFSYLPGAVWPVFPAATRKIPFLFSRNERLVAFCDTDLGAVALCMVGAFGVGRIRMVFDAPISNTGATALALGTVVPPYALERAAEVGRFEMGSTVVLLVPPGAVSWTVAAGAPVRLGERIGVVAR